MSVDSRSDPVALQTITELVKCPTRTTAFRRDTCARLKPRAFSACPAGRWKSTEPTAGDRVILTPPLTLVDGGEVQVL